MTSYTLTIINFTTQTNVNDSMYEDDEDECRKVSSTGSSTTIATMATKPSRVVDPWEINYEALQVFNRVGKGAFGEVFKGR